MGDLCEHHNPNCCTIREPIICPISPIIIVSPVPILGTHVTEIKTRVAPRSPPDKFHAFRGDAGSTLMKDLWYTVEIKMSTIIPIKNEQKAL